MASLQKLTALCFALATALLMSTIASPGASASADTTQVPQSLQPESINALVEKLDEEQTRALVSLVDLLQESVGQEPASGSGQSVIGLFSSWINGFGEAIFVNTINLPSALAELIGNVANVFAGDRKSVV